MKNLFIRLVALLGAAMAVHGVSAQEPQKHEAELRFDQAQREELADEPSPAVTAGFAAAGAPLPINSTANALRRPWLTTP